MKAFVTGGTGLLGSNLIRSIVWEGWQVHALVRSLEKAHSSIAGSGVSLVTGDMCEVQDFARELDGCDAVFHCAAQRDGSWDLIRQANVKGTVHLLTVAQRARILNFVYVAGSIALDETDEAVSRFVHHHPEMRVTAIAPGWMLGPNDVSRAPARHAIAQVLAGKPLPDLGPGACLVDVRDVALAMLRAVELGAGGRRYVVGGRFYATETLIETLSEVTGVPVRSDRSWLSSLKRSICGWKPVILNSEQAVTELGVAFRPLEETLRDTVDWFRHGPRASSLAAAA